MVKHDKIIFFALKNYVAHFLKSWLLWGVNNFLKLHDPKVSLSFQGIRIHMCIVHQTLGFRPNFRFANSSKTKRVNKRLFVIFQPFCSLVHLKQAHLGLNGKIWAKEFGQLNENSINKMLCISTSERTFKIKQAQFRPKHAVYIDL